MKQKKKDKINKDFIEFDIYLIKCVVKQRKAYLKKLNKNTLGLSWLYPPNMGNCLSSVK